MRTRHRFFAPEVVQSSAMDCGPAALKSLLDGFALPVSYGRPREACQTDVDGTSIDTLENVAVELGLEAEQILVPADHVLLPAAHALLALAVAELPNGAAHFVIVWSRHGRLVQIMDPAFGRRWISETRFLQELYEHTMRVPAAAWREWSGSDEARGAIESRLDALKVQKNTSRDLIEQASADPDWKALARLVAGVLSRIPRYGLSIGIGAAALVAVPVIATMICLTLVGLPVGILAFVAYVAAVYSAQVFVGAWLGRELLGPPVGQGDAIGRLALGLALIHVVWLVPFVGWLADLAVCLWGLGALTLYFFEPRATQNAPTQI